MACSRVNFTFTFTFIFIFSWNIHPTTVKASNLAALNVFHRFIGMRRSLYPNFVLSALMYCGFIIIIIIIIIYFFFF